jgi:ribosomal protein L40E
MKDARGAEVFEQTAAAGTFFCPQCKRETSYALMKATRSSITGYGENGPEYTLPEYLGHHVICRKCNLRFNATVLNLFSSRIAELRSPWKCPSCNQENPPRESRCIRCGHESLGRAPEGSHAFRRWSHKRAKFVTEARFLDMIGDRVVLERLDGQRAEMLRSELSPDDQKYLQDILDPVRICPSCESSYRLSEYRPDAARILCSACKSELPRW